MFAEDIPREDSRRWQSVVNSPSLVMPAAVNTVALMGSGLGGALALAAAARRPGAAAVSADTPLALGHPAALEGDPDYPLAELNDYLRVNPHRLEDVLANAAPLDPLKIASHVNMPVLLNLGRRDRGQCPLAIGEALASRLPQCDLRVYDGGSEGGGHEHGLVRVGWLRDRLNAHLRSLRRSWATLPWPWTVSEWPGRAPRLHDEKRRLGTGIRQRHLL